MTEQDRNFMDALPTHIESVFSENARQIAEVGALIEAEIARDPFQVERRGRENEYAVAVGYRETIEPFLQAIQKAPDAQLILTYGLTRCGKTLSMIKLAHAMNAHQKGSAAFVDMQGFDQHAPLDQLLLSITARVNSTTRGEVPKLLIIDEMGPFLVREEFTPDEFLAQICKAFPTTTITTIDVYGRNRGKVISTDVGMNPHHRYTDTIDALKSKSIQAAVHPHRDGWLQRSISDALVALSPEPETVLAQPELLRRAAKELGALVMGNPFVMRFIINEFREKGILNDIAAVRQVLYDINAFMLKQPNYLEMNQVYAELGLGTIGDVFDTAFGGYEYSDMLAKLRVASLAQSEAAEQSLDWASWGRF